MHSVIGIFTAVAVTAPAQAAPPPIVSAPSPAGSEPPQYAGMLAAHNQARRAVGVGDLQWSPQLAATAQAWAARLRGERCAMHHSGAPSVGENLAWAAGQHLTPAGVVAMWVQERRAFSAASKSCAPGAVCGHYTQVVWRSTRAVGCGIASCGGSEVWVCNYAPAGNMVGYPPY